MQLSRIMEVAAHGLSSKLCPVTIVTILVNVMLLICECCFVFFCFFPTSCLSCLVHAPNQQTAMTSGLKIPSLFFFQF